MNRPLFSLAAAAALVSSLCAESALAIKPLTVTSTAIANSEINAPESVEIYTREEIEDAHVQNVYEFLNQHTSVITLPNYGNPVLQKIDMRGFGIGDGYQNIVIRVNGRRMNNIDMVPQLLGSIPPSAIERIEIIKSGGIVAAGDGANAGVINITTKEEGADELAFYGGSHGTHSASVNTHHTGEKASLSVLADVYQTDGPRDIDDSGSSDRQQMSNGRVDYGYAVSDALMLRAAGQFTRTHSVYGGFLTLDEYKENAYQAGATNWGATEQRYESELVSVGASYEISPAWSFDADAAREKKTSVGWTVAHTTYDSVNVAANYGGEDLLVNAGAEYNNGKRSAVVDILKKSRAGFATVQYRVGGQTFKAGYRLERVSYDNTSDFTKAHTLHGVELGYNLQLNASESLFAGYTHSYQSADIDRLFNYMTGAFTGYVEPSQAHNVSLGYNRFTPTNKFKATLFYSDLKNEIYYYADPAWIASKNTNIDKSYKYGLDLYDKWLINDAWSVTLNYNYVQAIIDEEVQNGEDYSGNDLPGVSDHNVKATLSYLACEDTVVSVTQLYRSKAYAAEDFNNNFAQRQEAYSSTNIALTHTKENYELFAKINNLFNERNGIWIKDDVIYPVDFTTTVTAGLKFKF